MGKVVDLQKRFNHLWRTNPLYIRGFDYDSPKYSHVANDLKWMLPIHEAVSSPAEKARAAQTESTAKAKVENEFRRKAVTVISS